MYYNVMLTQYNVMRAVIHPGDTLIEATSGNTGIALAMAAAIKVGAGGSSLEDRGPVFGRGGGALVRHGVGHQGEGLKGPRSKGL